MVKPSKVCDMLWAIELAPITVAAKTAALSKPTSNKMLLSMLRRMLMLLLRFICGRGSSGLADDLDFVKTNVLLDHGHRLADLLIQFR